MTPPDFIIALFCQVDDQMTDVPKRPDATRSPSEVVPLALLFAIKGVGGRACDRGLKGDSTAWCPQRPERTRWLRLCKPPTPWMARVLSSPTVVGGADSSGIERVHPMREGRSPHQIGKKGKSNHRGSVGGKLAFVLHQWGVLCAWDCATANVSAAHVPPLLAPGDQRMMVWTDTGCHAKPGDPANMQICQRGTWNVRRLGETVLSMWTTVFQGQQRRHRVWAYFRGHLAWAMAACNILAQWTLEVDDDGIGHLSIAEFSL